MDGAEIAGPTLAAQTPIANVVDTNYTVVAKIPKRHLRGAVAMRGMHDRLRRVASG